MLTVLFRMHEGPYEQRTFPDRRAYQDWLNDWDSYLDEVTILGGRRAR